MKFHLLLLLAFFSVQCSTGSHHVTTPFEHEHLQTATGACVTTVGKGGLQADAKTLQKLVIDNLKSDGVFAKVTGCKKKPVKGQVRLRLSLEALDGGSPLIWMLSAGFGGRPKASVSGALKSDKKTIGEFAAEGVTPGFMSVFSDFRLKALESAAMEIAAAVKSAKETGE